MRTVPKLVVVSVIYLLCFGVSLFWPKPISLWASSRSHSYPGKSPVVSYFHKRLLTGGYIDYSDPSHRLVLSHVIEDHTRTSGVMLTVMPSVVQNGEEVTVLWNGVSVSTKAKSMDWIGLFCPQDADPNAYLDYWFVNQSPTYSKGHGKVSFNVYNIRVDCEFRYYINNTAAKTTELLARSNLLKFSGGHDNPLQSHLALTGDPTQMRVQWTSGSKSIPIVRYGSSSNLTQMVKGISRTYGASDMCGPPATDPVNFIDPGYLHDVLLTNLLPDTTYFYQYGSNVSFSNVNKFTTAPQIGSENSYKFITYGDMGLTGLSGASDTVKLITQELNTGSKFILHHGDLSYAVGYAYIWEQWMHLIEPLASRVPYMVGIGNHEVDFLKAFASNSNMDDGFHPSWGNYGHDSGGECGVPTLNRFHMPDNGKGVYWYSFEYGPVHFTLMSTEHNFTRGTQQYEWLDRDLRGVDRNKTPWLILVGHRPMYTSEKYHDDHVVSLHIQEEVEDLLHQHKVDIAIWSHYHSYERTCRVYKQRCTETGTVHLVIGAAGAHLDSVPQYEVKWSEHLEMNYGFGRVTVANGSALLWEYMRNVDHVVADSAWIIK